MSNYDPNKKTTRKPVVAKEYVIDPDKAIIIVQDDGVEQYDGAEGFILGLGTLILTFIGGIVCGSAMTRLQKLEEKAG